MYPLTTRLDSVILNEVLLKAQSSDMVAYPVTLNGFGRTVVSNEIRANDGASIGWRMAVCQGFVEPISFFDVTVLRIIALTRVKFASSDGSRDACCQRNMRKNNSTNFRTLAIGMQQNETGNNCGGS